MEFEVFPDNWLAVNVFRDMGTQWRVGMNGPTGLDYNVFPIIARARGISRREWSELLTMIQVMEDEALRVIHSAQ